MIFLFLPEIIVFVLFFSISILFIWVYFKYYRPARLMFKLKSFFSLRDDFIYLMAKDPKKKDDTLINYYINNINIIIRKAKFFHLDLFIEAMTELKRQAKIDDDVAKIIEKIKKSDDETIMLIKSYYNNLLIFIIINSPIGMILKTVLKLTGELYVLKLYYFLLSLIVFFLPRKKPEKQFISEVENMILQLS